VVHKDAYEELEDYLHYEDEDVEAIWMKLIVVVHLVSVSATADGEIMVCQG